MWPRHQGRGHGLERLVAKFHRWRRRRPACALLILSRRNQDRAAALPRLGMPAHRQRAGQGLCMKHASIRELFAYWNLRRGARLAPDRSDIDPAVIRGVLADTFILA